LALNAEQRPEEALTLAEQAVVVSRLEARAYQAKAQALKQLGRAEEMRVAVEQGMSIVEQLFANSPEHPNLVRLRTQLMQALEREESAPEAQDA
jgi:Flp pilus assembly protein TadD